MTSPYQKTYLKIYYDKRRIVKMIINTSAILKKGDWGFPQKLTKPPNLIFGGFIKYRNMGTCCSAR